jgi:hypothetical protein
VTASPETKHDATAFDGVTPILCVVDMHASVDAFPMQLEIFGNRFCMRFARGMPSVSLPGRSGTPG